MRTGTATAIFLAVSVACSTCHAQQGNTGSSSRSRLSDKWNLVKKNEQNAQPRDTGIRDPNQSRIQQRQASQSSQNTKAGAKPTPQTRGVSGTRTFSSGRTTTGSKSMARGGTARPGGPAGATANAPASTGHVKEVSKAFLDSIRTRKVDYDEEEMSGQPGVIILNPRKYKAPPSALERGASGMSGASPSIARPL